MIEEFRRSIREYDLTELAIDPVLKEHFAASSRGVGQGRGMRAKDGACTLGALSHLLAKLPAINGSEAFKSQKHGVK